jgi:hypothetical protein
MCRKGMTTSVSLLTSLARISLPPDTALFVVSLDYFVNEGIFIHAPLHWLADGSI